MTSASEFSFHIPLIPIRDLKFSGTVFPAFSTNLIQFLPFHQLVSFCHFSVKSFGISVILLYSIILILYKFICLIYYPPPENLQYRTFLLFAFFFTDKKFMIRKPNTIFTFQLESFLAPKILIQQSRSSYFCFTTLIFLLIIYRGNKTYKQSAIPIYSREYILYNLKFITWHLCRIPFFSETYLIHSKYHFMITRASFWTFQ